MWALEFEDAAAKAFRKLDGKVQRTIKAKLDELQALADPSAMAKPLQHRLKGLWRLHLGGMRVLFRLERGALVIIVVEVGRRDSVYD